VTFRADDLGGLVAMESMLTKSQFGGGARTCIGKNISLLEISKVVPQLYRQFDFELDEDHNYTKDCVWFVKPHFEMKVALRKT